MYKKIKNPETGKFVNILGRTGKSVIREYLNQVGGHGGSCALNSKGNRCKKSPVADEENCELVKGKCKKKNNKSKIKKTLKSKKGTSKSIVKSPKKNITKPITKVGDSNTFLNKITIVDYGVLGDSGGRGSPDITNTTVVDPAGLPYITGSYTPSRAGAASRAIYNWCGLAKKQSFPQPIKDAVKKPSDAKLHIYGSGNQSKYIIHVVGPDFRGGGDTTSQAIDILSKSYTNVFKECGDLPVSITNVHLLPISGGVFLGKFKDNLMHITMTAIKTGFSRLNASEKKTILAKNIKLCIFDEDEFEPFKVAQILSTY